MAKVCASLKSKSLPRFDPSKSRSPKRRRGTGAKTAPGGEGSSGMNPQSTGALRSGPVVQRLVGCNGENPQVSHVSRFHEDLWDFSNEDRNPARGDGEKTICWSFRLPHDRLFTDARFRSLLTALKQFICALRWHPIDSPPFSASALPSIFQRAKRFIDHLVGYPPPILRFKDVLPHHCKDYIEGLLHSGLSPTTNITVLMFSRSSLPTGA